MFIVDFCAESIGQKSREHEANDYCYKPKCILTNHSTILVVGLLLFAITIPVKACNVAVLVVNPLSFGELVSPPGFDGFGWAEVSLNGQYSLSSSSLSPSFTELVTEGVSLGKLRVRVEDAEPGSPVSVRLSTSSPSLLLYPVSEQVFHLYSGSSSGEFYVNYGGRLLLEDLAVGSTVSDILVETSCTPFDSGN